MKITAQEEYGLRILLRIARFGNEGGVSIPMISETEGLSAAYAGKLTRTLRMAGYINSTPGYKGGYVLSKPASEININQVMKALGGSLYSKEFCEDYSGISRLCTNSIDCSVRSLWQMIQFSVDQLLDKISLQDLIGNEKESNLNIQNTLALLYGK
ncbi:Rrf2 family transcriptional regulator [Pedobacter frigoris]|uniref:RrF2 family transcriptional regulator n=1 Tax=Pedobacter frigoris TaxID=2571272 RepID=UPI00293140E0|nr:Rrf2 family transcriptional regulator [Pedobacter frigoris]